MKISDLDFREKEKVYEREHWVAWCKANNHDVNNPLRPLGSFPPPLQPVNGDRWGDWVLNLEPADNPSLDYVGEGYNHGNPYWIELSRLNSWQGLNHWMHHLWSKSWGQKYMGDFICAVMDVCGLWKKFPG